MIRVTSYLEIFTNGLVGVYIVDELIIFTYIDYVKYVGFMIFNHEPLIL